MRVDGTITSVVLSPDTWGNHTVGLGELRGTLQLDGDQVPFVFGITYGDGGEHVNTVSERSLDLGEAEETMSARSYKLLMEGLTQHFEANFDDPDEGEFPGEEWLAANGFRKPPDSDQVYSETTRPFAIEVE